MPPASAVVSPDYDLVCIGFGPAALAIAVAIHDLKSSTKVLFLEKQKQFAWHAGMLLPGAKMQISFLKDLATFRDPRSHFTFLNYLKENDRLEGFTNLSTFLPLRKEFNDYLTWAAGHFEHQVQYDTAAESIESLPPAHNRIEGWKVNAIHSSQRSQSYTTKNVIIATGGIPQLPHFLQDISPKIIHTSKYLFNVPQSVPTNKPESELNLVVIGGGQSSAETFNDLTHRFPEARITLFTAGSALKPSDDSPFVNEIFNPSLVDTIYTLPPTARESLTSNNRATNYSVVRPELLEHLYSAQYEQRLSYGNDESNWRHRIVGSHRLVKASKEAGQTLMLNLENTLTGDISTASKVDLVVCGTGYDRNGHEALLQPVRDLLACEDPEGMSDVDRDYKLRFRDGVLAQGSGIWLQGVCESTHGLSDSLLSILAVRAGEVVESIFGGSNLGNAGIQRNGHANGYLSKINGKSNGIANGLSIHRNGTHSNGIASNGH